MITADGLPKILRALDTLLENKGVRIHLLVGGAGALLGAYQYADSTSDVDAIPLRGDFSEIQTELDVIAKQFKLAPDWINPHFSSFTIYLPQDYRARCTRIFSGASLLVDVLGAEELLIMKFMAGRRKDHSHIKFLLKQSPDLNIVEDRLFELKDVFPDLAKRALELFDSLTEDSQ